MDINTLRELKKQLLSELKETTMNPRIVFEQVLKMKRTAMEFPTEEAREKYLKDHPGADKSKHTVKKTEGPSESKEKEEPKDKEEVPELSKKKQLAVDRAYQKSEAYKTEKKEGYYPQKAPEGMKYPEELDALPGDLKEHVMSMVEEDLDKEESYSHPKLNKLKKAIIKRLRTVGQRLEVEKEFQQLETLSGELSKKRRHAESDAEADPYRFAVRKVYHAWQAYNIAFQEWHRSDKEATMNPRKEFEHVLLVNRVASRYATEFPTEEALKKYLKDHPDADKSKHKVKKKEESTTSKADDDFSDLPQDLTKLTESQTKKVINHMSKWPLSKLRKHQDLVDKQTEKAYDAKDDKALTNLQIQRKHLDSAVDKKEFGE